MADKNTLHLFLKRYSGLQTWHGPLERIDYTRFSTDTRQIQAGDLFIALKGERFDGHQFVGQAIQKGAAGVVVNREFYFASPENKFPPEVSVIVVQDTLNFLQELAHWHRKRFQIPVVGLTGSSGKTTTREMIAHILSRKFIVLRNLKNQNNQIGVPLTLLKLNESIEVAVVEMGTNHPGEIARLAEITEPTHGLITNIGKGHVGFFGGLEAIFEEKTALFQKVKVGGTIFLNIEDPFLKKYSRDDCEIVRVGATRGADVWGEPLDLDEEGRLTFRLNGQLTIKIGVPGRHQFMNALLAAAVGLHMGVPGADIQAALESFQPAHQRMELLNQNGVFIINDAYNANPDSTRAALEFLQHLPSRGGKKVFVFGDMLELGDFSADEHRKIGEFLHSLDIEVVLLYGQETRFVQEALLNRGAPDKLVEHFANHEALGKKLQELLEQGDIVLIKGSRGMAMETVLTYLER